MTGFESYSFFFWLATFVVTSINGDGQHISIGTWAGSNISIRAVSVNTLNFGNLFKGSSSPNSIALSGAAAFEITAPEDYDLTVSIDAPSTLNGPDSKTIPFSLEFAYSNQGLTESKARLHTVEVTKGLYMVTFPVMGSPMKPRVSPPTSVESANSTRLTGKAFLYIFGTAGPPTAEAVAGEYSGNVNITVE